MDKKLILLIGILVAAMCCCISCIAAAYGALKSSAQPIDGYWRIYKIKGIDNVWKTQDELPSIQQNQYASVETTEDQIQFSFYDLREDKFEKQKVPIMFQIETSPSLTETETKAALIPPKKGMTKLKGSLEYPYEKSQQLLKLTFYGMNKEKEKVHFMTMVFQRLASEPTIEK